MVVLLAVDFVIIIAIFVVVLAVTVVVVFVVILLLFMLLLSKNTHPSTISAVGLGTGWIMASRSSTQTRKRKLTKSYLYLRQVLSCF